MSARARLVRLVCRALVLLVCLVGVVHVAVADPAPGAPGASGNKQKLVPGNPSPALKNLPSEPDPNDPSSGALAGPTSGLTTGAGALEISTLYGQPIELEPHGQGFVGQFSLRNGGAKPLSIKQLSFRPTTDTPDPAQDPDLLVKVGEGAQQSFTLAPGATRKVSVVWTPSRLTRLKQLYTQVIVEPDGSGAPVQMVGVHATRATALPLVTDHPLGWLLLLPLLGAIAAAGLGLRSEAKPDPRIRLIGLGVTFAQLLLALYAIATFDPELTRVVGNDGLQLVDRVVVSRAFGLEMSLGVDGLGLVLVTLVAVVSFLAILVTPGADEKRRPSRAEGRVVPLVLLVSASAMAFFTVGDLVLLLLFGALLTVNAVRLVAADPTERARLVARRLGITWTVGLVLLAIAVMVLRAASGAVFLLDGSRAEHVSSIAELARQGLVAHGALAESQVKWVYLLVLAAAVLLSPLVPLGGGLVAAVTPASVSTKKPVAPFAGGALPLMLAGALVPAGMYLVLRVAVPVVPEAVRWAGPATATLGAVLMLASVAAGWVSSSLPRRAAFLAGAQSGLVLLGIGSLTQEGIAAGYLMTVAPAIAFLFLAGFGLRPESRGGRVVTSVGVVFAAMLAGPGAWGTLLAATGALASTPVASVVGWVAFVLGAGVGAFGVCRRFARAATRTGSARWSNGEVGSVAFVLLVGAVLTVWPAALVTPFSGALRDSVDKLDPPGPDQIALR